MKFFSTLLTVSLVCFLSACAGDLTVSPGYHPSIGAYAPLAAIPPATIKVLGVEDKREAVSGPTHIGSREAAFGVSMGNVYSVPPAPEIVRAAVEEALAAVGQRVAEDSQDVSIKGNLLAFRVATEVTPMYWDVVGDVAVVLEATRFADGRMVVLGPYEGKSVERTYANPGAEIVTRVLNQALAEAMSAMGADPKLAQTLAGVPRK